MIIDLTQFIGCSFKNFERETGIIALNDDPDYPIQLVMDGPTFRYWSATKGGLIYKDGRYSVFNVDEVYSAGQVIVLDRHYPVFNNEEVENLDDHFFGDIYLTKDEENKFVARSNYNLSDDKECVLIKSDALYVDLKLVLTVLEAIERLDSNEN